MSPDEAIYCFGEGHSEERVQIVEMGRLRVWEKVGCGEASRLVKALVAVGTKKRRACQCKSRTEA